MNCQINNYFDADAPSIFSSITVKAARKDHVCCECGRKINRGESYKYERGVWDGEFDSYKICADCLSVRDAFFCSWTYTELWNDFSEEIDLSDGGEHLANRLNELTPAARDRACSLFDNYYEARRNNADKNRMV